MARGVRTTVIASIAFVALVLGMFFYSMTRPPLLDIEALAEQGIVVLPTARPIAPFELTDQKGEPFDETDLKGRWSFLFFGFTSCPDVCPVALAALAQVQRQLAEDGDEALRRAFKVVLVTVDPERDDAQTLARYVAAFSSDFTGVRGSRDAIAAFARELNVAFMNVPLEGGGYSVDHTANIVVIDPEGRYHAFIKRPHDPDKILLGYRSMAASY